MLYSMVGVVSLVMLFWLDLFFFVGLKSLLEFKDIFFFVLSDSVKLSYKVLKLNWKSLKFENNFFLVCVIFKFFWKEVVCNVVFVGLNIFVFYVGFYLVNDFVNYLGGKEIYFYEGYIFVGIFFVVKFVEILMIW